MSCVAGRESRRQEQLLFAIRLVLDPTLPDSARQLKLSDFWDRGLSRFLNVEIVRWEIIKRLIEGETRTQVTLLPDCLDAYVAEENPVRVVDVFVDELDLGALGFEAVDPAATGPPAYHPAVLLKIQIYGYLNLIQSGRRLEREAERNVKLMWLTARLVEQPTLPVNSSA